MIQSHRALLIITILGELAMMPGGAFGLPIIFAYDAKSYWLTFFHYGLLIITILGISSNDAQWRLWSVTIFLPMIWLTFLHCDSSSPSSAMMRSGAFGLPCVCYLQSFFCSAPKSRALECCCHLKPSSSVLSPSNIFIL